MKFNTILTILLCSLVLTTQAQNQKPLATIARADSLLFSGDPKSACEIYSKILKDTSRNAGAWSRYGFANLNLKNYDAAIKYLEKALTLQPPRPVKMNTFASLARSYSVKGNKIKALVNLDSAAKLGYTNFNVLDTNDDYKNIRDDDKFKMIRQAVYASAYPCMSNPHAREFDFWIGDWDVFATGTKNNVGHNKIEMISKGCALLENWDSNASSGKSLNFIDPLTGKWRQTWVGSYTNGIQDFTNGEYKDGAMRFIFEGLRNGQKFIGRFIFYNEKPGQVRQFNETSTDGGKTWVTTYDFTYVRKD